MNTSIITLEDCLINFEVNYKRTIINDGQIIDFEEDFEMISYTPYIVHLKE